MQYFGADGLGSVRQIYDASAMVVGSTRYDPFGNVMSQSGRARVCALPSPRPALEHTAGQLACPVTESRPRFRFYFLPMNNPYPRY